MVVDSLKNYFKNFRYVIISMGVIFFSLLLIFITCAAGFFEIIFNMANSVWSNLTEIIDEVNITRANIFNLEYYQEIIKNIELVLKQCGSETLSELNNLLVGAGFFAVITVIFAWWYTKRWIRKDMIHSKHTAIRIVFVWIYRTIFLFLFTFLSTYLLTISGYFAILLLVSFLFWIAFDNIIVTWYVYFPKRKLRDFLKLKYYFSSIVVQYLLLFLTIVLIVLISFINLILAFLLAIPIVIYGLAMIEVSQLDFYNREIPNK